MTKKKDPSNGMFGLQSVRRKIEIFSQVLMIIAFSFIGFIMLLRILWQR